MYTETNFKILNIEIQKKKTNTKQKNLSKKKNLIKQKIQKSNKINKKPLHFNALY